MVELGVQVGDNAINILKSCPGLRKFVAVDMWVREHEYQTWLNRAKSYKGIVKTNRNMTQEAYHSYGDHEFDLIFIDACHSTEAVIADIINWTPKIKMSGIICGHDIVYRKVWKAVKQMIPNFKVWMGKSDAVWFYELNVDQKIYEESERFIGARREFVFTK
jgi:predicted O-methyltransferase YrrM